MKYIIKKLFVFSCVLILSTGLIAKHPVLRWNWSGINLEDNNFFHALTFPENFKWGIADSAYQTEGALYYDGKMCQNNWTQWEQLCDEHGNPRIKDGHTVGKSCDKWNKYKEDIALIKASGFKSYRFSIEWSKIEPEEGVFDERAMQHYIDVVEELVKNDIEPVVMLFHQTWPLWFDKKGAFEHEQNIPYFVEFGEYVFKKLHHNVKTWMTINEPTGYAMAAYFMGDCSPGKKSLQLAGEVLKNFLDTHIALYRLFKNIDASVSIGYSKVVQLIDPYHAWNPLENLVSGTFDSLVNDTDLHYFKTGIFKWYIPFWCDVRAVNKNALKTLDFIGVNYYSHTSLRMYARLPELMAPSAHPDEIITDNGNVIYPEGMYRAIARCSMLGIPMYVAENGVADNNDIFKDHYIKQHVYAVSKACADGYDVRGYFYWTLIDNFEWNKGYTEKFGLYSFNEQTQERTLKKGSYPFISYLQSII